MSTKDKIEELLGMFSDCIVVGPRLGYDKNGRYISDGFTVLGETRNCLGCSRGVGSRYDWGFMQLDVESGINVVILH